LTFKIILHRAAQFFEPSASGEDKYKLYLLSKAINSGAEVELNTEQVAHLKDVIGKNFHPIIVGRVWDFLGITGKPKSKGLRVV